MRLHTLELQAFQAFPGTERIDFDALAEDGLFLLRGDTGAGKTTILDAVCFAFYGALPGARGKDARVRSDHATADTATQVVLEATLRGERVRITRSPEQERPKLRGDGMTKEAAKVLVEVVEADGRHRPIATRHEEAREELTRLLGMSREQFCQVVLLPQGEFATFLRASSEDRKALLTQLFAAERFGHVEDWLTARRKAATADEREAAAGVTDIASRLAQVAGEEPPDGWPDDLDLLTGWLGERRVLADAGRATAASARADAADADAVADRALQDAQTLADRRARHARARAALDALEADAAAHAARGAELDAARRAAGVVPLLGDAVARAAEAARAQEHAGGLLARAGADTVDAATLREAAAEARRAAGEAQGHTHLQDRLDERRRIVAEHARALEADRAALAEADGRLARADAERAALVARAEIAAEAAAAIAPLELQLARAHEVAEAAAARDRALALAAARTTERDAARASALAAKESLLDIRQARLAGMAAELAGRLVDGEACAVCGALDHPHPAAPAPGAPDADAEERAAALCETRQAALEEAEDRLRAVQADVRAAQAHAGDRPLSEAEDAERGLVAALAHARDRAADTQAAALLAEHDATTDERQAARAALAETVAATQERLRSLTTEAEADAQQLAALLGDAPDVPTLVARHETRAAALEAAADAVLAAHRAAEEAGRAERAADVAAQEAGFADRDAARDAARDTAACAALEERRRAHDERVAEARGVLAEPEVVAAVAAAAPDVPAAQAARRAAHEALADAQRELDRAERLQGELGGLAHELDARLVALAPRREAARRIRELAMLADGSAAANRKKMRLSAYVLAARLEEIAEAASVRLEGMSGGRYTLVHSDAGGRRGKQGLDLLVVDGWTGQERAPATLSGGETFLASLALALGLADVVTAEAGGAPLETLFVDEGFGSLDDAALDEVLDVLDRLRDGGRSVGIVSHVAELRQRITAQLHVVKGRDGSTVVQPGGPAARA